MKNSVNKKLVESFWVRYISKIQTFKEVRWDLFEEAITDYIKSYLVMNVAVIKKINWARFLLHLKNLISDNESNGQHENTEIVFRPLQEIIDVYTGSVVRCETVIKFSQEFSLDGHLLKLIDETANEKENDGKKQIASGHSSPKSGLKLKQFSEQYKIESDMKNGTIRY